MVDDSSAVKEVAEALTKEVAEEEVRLNDAVVLRVRHVKPVSLVVAENTGTIPKGCDVTGFQVWGVGLCVARILAKAGSKFWKDFGGPRANAIAVELGCGCGSLGLAVACVAEGFRVVLTDASPTALSFARANAAANASIFAEGVKVAVERLLWTRAGQGQEDEASAAATTSPLSSAKLILATDVMYHLSCSAALFDTAARLLAPEGLFIISGHSRYHGTIEEIISNCSRLRLQVRTYPNLRMEHERKWDKCPTLIASHKILLSAYSALLLGRLRQPRGAAAESRFRDGGRGKFRRFLLA